MPVVSMTCAAQAQARRHRHPTAPGFSARRFSGSRPLTSTWKCSSSSSKNTSSSSRSNFGLLDWAGSTFIPQGPIVSSTKFAWNTMWKTLMSELAPQDQSGAYTRPPAAYTSVVGVTPSFPASSSYTLYIGNACPWCHRVAIAAALRGVPAESLRIVKLVDDAERASRGGWIVESGRDPLFGAKDLREIYDSAAGGQYFGRCTAPLLVSDAQKVVVANDSAEIVRSIDALPGDDVTLRPAALAAEVDKWVERITSEVNNGVYRAGFATSQTAHDAAALPLYRLLDELDQHLETRRFLCGGSVTEADVVLLPTICRFDDVYSVLFKCSGRRIADLPNLSGWLADMMRLSVIADTYDAASARSSYFGQLFPLNPSGIIPAGGRSTKELVAQWLSRSDPAKRERLAVGVSALHTRD